MNAIELRLNDLNRVLPGGDEKHPVIHAFRKLLSRARISPAEGDYHRWWADRLALSCTGNRIPIAALACLGAGVTPGRWTLFADPVHLRADRDRVLLLAAEQLQVSEMEAQTLCAAIERLYQDESWRLVAITPQTWCISLPHPTAVEFTPLSDVMGEDVYPLLPGGEQARYWRQRLNEVQMLLHDTEVNRTRSASGALEINSVWFWGEGSVESLAPVTRDSSPCRVVSDDAFVRGLAVFCHHPWVTQVNGAVALIAQANLDTDAAVARLICSIDLNPDPSSPHTALQILAEFQQNWLTPLCVAVLNDQLSAFTLVSGRQGFRFEARDLKRWWRRTKSLAELL